MLQGPVTRLSLIAELHAPDSQQAWSEFVSIYRPLIMRVALAKGLQHADSEDLAQEVLATVGRNIRLYQDRGAGSFRAWLFQVTRNLVVNHLTRGGPPLGSGDSSVQAMLQQEPDPGNETATLFQLEYRRLRFRTAAETLRPAFNESTWQCFWLTAVDGQSIDQVAQQLNKSNGAVRVARSRVMSRLRAEVIGDEELDH